MSSKKMPALQKEFYIRMFSIGYLAPMSAKHIPRIICGFITKTYRIRHGSNEHFATTSMSVFIEKYKTGKITWDYYRNKTYNESSS